MPWVSASAGGNRATASSGGQAANAPSVRRKPKKHTNKKESYARGESLAVTQNFWVLTTNSVFPLSQGQGQRIGPNPTAQHQPNKPKIASGNEDTYPEPCAGTSGAPACVGFPAAAVAAAAADLCHPHPGGPTLWFPLRARRHSLPITPSEAVPTDRSNEAE